jgi:hypothetical protein
MKDFENENKARKDERDEIIQMIIDTKVSPVVFINSTMT